MELHVGNALAQQLQQSERALVPVGNVTSSEANSRRRRRVWKQLVVAALVFSDVSLALLVWWLASALQGVWGKGELTTVTIVTMVPVIAEWVGLRALLGLYPGYGLGSVEELRRHTYALSVTMAVLAIFAVGLHIGDLLSRLLFVLFFLSLLLVAPFARYAVKRGLREIGLWGSPVIVLGSGQNLGKVRWGVTRRLQEKWELGYKPVAVFNCRLNRATQGRRDDSGSAYTEEARAADEETLTSVAEMARRQGVDTAVFAMPYTRREQVAELVGLASIHFRHVLVMPNLGGVTNSAVVARDLAGTFAVEIKYNLLNPWALRAKRIADLAATVVGGLIVSPLLVLLASLVYLESRGPIFYKDLRMGRDGNLFSCVKFCTMVPNAEALLQRMLEEDSALRDEYSKYHKLRDDPRVTRIGSFLRKSSLDELPQLWNVLRGDMSLVGPRPYLPRESKEIGATQSEILRVPPGITGPWQVAGRNQTFFGERVQLDAYYVRDWSVWLDLVILAQTVKTVALGRGAL